MKVFIAVATLVALACAQQAKSSFDMKLAFAMADTNGDGFEDKMEWDALYAKFDANSDGNIDATEFVTGFMKTGMSYKGSLYVFFKMDKNDDVLVDSQEIDATFASFDMDGDNLVSEAEFTAVMTVILGQLAKAATYQPKIDTLFDGVDADSDGQLAATEMGGLIANADTNQDGTLSQDEFSSFFMTTVGMSQDEADEFFALVDADKDGSFGGDLEKKGLFDAFDYGDDNMVSKEEFSNAMLSIYATVTSALTDRAAANAVVGF